MFFLLISKYLITNFRKQQTIITKLHKQQTNYKVTQLENYKVVQIANKLQSYAEITTRHKITKLRKHFLLNFAKLILAILRYCYQNLEIFL